MSRPTTEATSEGRLRDQPAFRWLVAARWTDTVGNAVAPIALAFAVLDLTGSATDVGIVVGARSAAMVVFVLLGGVLADRLGRSVVLVWSNAVAGIGQAVVAWLVLGGTATIPALVALSALHGAAGAMSLPASAAMVPATVPRPLLQRANAFTSAGVSASVASRPSPAWPSRHSRPCDTCPSPVHGVLNRRDADWCRPHRWRHWPGPAEEPAHR